MNAENQSFEQIAVLTHIKSKEQLARESKHRRWRRYRKNPELRGAIEEIGKFFRALGAIPDDFETTKKRRIFNRLVSEINTWWAVEKKRKALFSRQGVAKMVQTFFKEHPHKNTLHTPEYLFVNEILSRRGRESAETRRKSAARLAKTQKRETAEARQFKFDFTH